MTNENSAQTSLASNEEEISHLKKMVDDSQCGAFLCTTIKAENPNYLAITYSNDIFCETFEQEKNDLIGKSYDFLFGDVDVNYSSEEQLEYIRIIKSVKNREECSVILKLDSKPEGEHQITKFKIGFKPIIDENSSKFYAILSFQKISTEAIDDDENQTGNSDIKTQNQALVKNMERALSNEKLLREISYLIISDKPVKEIAQSVAASLCNALKVDRCIIHDKKEDKINFIVEFCSPQVKTILHAENGAKITEDYINIQGKFFSQKIKKDSRKSSLFIANNLKSDSSFSDSREFFQKFAVDSQIVAITSFDGEINGGIYMHSSQNRNLTVDEMELVELIADQLSIAIDRSSSIEKVMIANHNLLTKTLELKESVKKEKEMRKMQTEFVALVSHEFKTPLQIIDSNRELMSRKIKKLDALDGSCDNYLTRIKDAINRMTGLIDTTLDLARMEGGKNDIKVVKEKFDLHDLIKDIIDKTSNLAANKNIKIVTNFCENGAVINADPKLLDHCFTNIISNAIKYSGENTETKITTQTNANKIAIRVVDHGIGIPKEDVDKIGQKFFRAKNTLAVSGTGIGIYLTKYFIELHDGSVKIESELNVGTSFTVILPKNLS